MMSAGRWGSFRAVRMSPWTSLVDRLWRTRREIPRDAPRLAHDPMPPALGRAFPASNASIDPHKFIIYKEFLLRTGAFCCVRSQTC